MLWLDLETYSVKPIKHGGYAYAAAAEILLIAYAIDDGDVSVCDLTADVMPNDLREAILDPDQLITAHGSMFDRTVLRLAPGFRLDIPIHRWRDTMVQAQTHSLPGKLGTLCDIFNLSSDQAKAKTGKLLVALFCKPRSGGGRATRETHPEKWSQFIDYARMDVVSMRTLAARMPTWNYNAQELALWYIDQRINDRGMLVDLELAQAAVRVVAEEKVLVRGAVNTLTAGAVPSATQRVVLKDYILEEYGVHLPDLTKTTVVGVLADPRTPEHLKVLLDLRLKASGTSTTKYTALLKGVNTDGRLRGTKQFRGASRTGRWAGRLFQPDNLPRPTVPKKHIDQGIEDIKSGAISLFGGIEQMASSAIRGCIIAPAGGRLVVSDLANIEGRIAAWVAGEEWKLQAFRDYDTIVGEDSDGKAIRKGLDLYCLAYSRAFNIPIAEVTEDFRQIGKVMELAFGFGGGVNALVAASVVYNIDLSALAESAFPSIPDATVNEAEAFFEWLDKKSATPKGMAKKTFIACDSLKRLWRSANPRIASIWKALESAVTYALAYPGSETSCRVFKIRKDGAWLRIGMPSGRTLCYPAIRLDDEGHISYMGVDTHAHWVRLQTFGGKLFENICQALACDVLAQNMGGIENAGYKIVLTVHDEVVAETLDGSVDELSGLLSAELPWASGLPLAAAGFETLRYRKG